MLRFTDVYKIKLRIACIQQYELGVKDEFAAKTIYEEIFAKKGNVTKKIYQQAFFSFVNLLSYSSDKSIQDHERALSLLLSAEKEDFSLDFQRENMRSALAYLYQYGSEMVKNLGKAKELKTQMLKETQKSMRLLKDLYSIEVAQTDQEGAEAALKGIFDHPEFKTEILGSLMPFYNFLDDLSCQVAVRLLDLIIERDSKCVKALEGLANILEHGHETVRNPVKLSEIGHSLLDLAQDAGDKRTALRILFRVYKQPELMTDENFPVYRKKAYVVYEQVMNDQDMGADERKYAIRRVIRLYWQNRDVS